MSLCKYCGAPLSWLQTDFCDKICKKMFELNGAPLKVEKKSTDKFDDFIKKQKEAREKGLKYSYGDYQTENCKPIDIPKKEDTEVMQCQDCKFFIEDKYGLHTCEMKPYTRNGKRRLHPQKYTKACKTYFKPKN